MVSSLKLWTTLLSLIVTASALALDKRVQYIPIGYRTVLPGGAVAYHKAGDTLTYKASGSADQLGPGAYISPAIGEWAVGPTSWDCAILADAPAWNRVNKAWVPATADDGCTPLWWDKGEKNRNAYLQEVGGKGMTTDNTVLFSKIQGFDLVQMLIPESLLGKSGGLNIHVQCAAKTDKKGIEQISAYGQIDWYSWNNVKGTPQRV
ncbi:hypothetical protein F5Y17DRAFT_458232 [Xylariaceae sp. FL0594]|nr:hypothetical protein F5Y17DRAFT_458232 [Xylariaceae sp. FL0594]